MQVGVKMEAFGKAKFSMYSMYISEHKNYDEIFVTHDGKMPYSWFL